jgi:fumarate reductase subunit C
MRPVLRVIVNRPASNVPWVNREPEKPADAVDFMNNAVLVVCGLLALAAVALFCIFVFSLQRLT